MSHPAHIKNALKKKQREMGNHDMKDNPAYPKKKGKMVDADDGADESGELQQIGKA